MPELPEVETTRRGIAPYLEGREIHEVIVRNRRLRLPVPEGLENALIGSRIGTLSRRAKYLILPIESPTDSAVTDGAPVGDALHDEEAAGPALLWHLGMSGSLRIARLGDPPKKHDHVDLVMEDGAILRYHDPRRFGFLDWLQGDVASDRRFVRLGPEPLSPAFDDERLFQCSRKRRLAVKPFLMDNAVVVGVGNIYAAEALFLAGIDPRRAAGQISRERYVRLTAAIREVLSSAITQGGTTLRDFVSGTGEPGYFAQRLNVYGRDGEPCRRCGRELRLVTLGQRASVFCPNCQT
ncbi:MULTISPECIES: bifunctional DNA-formamidopyrimidine glycosylase/DNA-(apurinic or apyrimidinic site) lyase [Halomonadaceae]|uniref:bifunctional DNA-formamidopyrimidine glycosylase/DNA-(apurinic or apyrimidinic site) lyase n=1 Tax=Halomonadaceae TaxID=28256 RepID=UPI0015825469|nr:MULTISPECIES: bifunctional DNA-formamidopyrimidine glycosylase/DNA-(apurinic or apyrimidinic site) lyase [Halomonas]MDI4637308.1 bifunctional DNA-formamidopyrimidine glycosylase/DNA-(apurinic or apyrimidinic site) lyase [Halomonas sp. BMC7]NUJ58476.1 bifunctional DNA-formamidopyrimidine glycosylase/DNA-(apurinic or apyrimidinic site) lyase [Halomonas taeanensis]